MSFLNSFLVVLCVTFLSFAQTNEVETISLTQLQSKTVHPENNTLYVVNFWATWCKPCILELPYFEEAGKKYAAQNVKIMLVSLDFVSEKEKVKQFVAKKKFQNEVYLLDAGNPNKWIDSIDAAWDGAIPATVMYKGGKKVYFTEGELSALELDSIIQTKK